MGRILDWLDHRSGYRGALRAALEESIPGGASFAYVFGSVLVFLLGLQMTTGLFLAMYYSPSSTDAWASVAFLNDQVTMGWFIRGLHSYGASAMVIVAGLHMLQTAAYGAYKKPRELNWILGVLMLGLILAFALTGYLLPWDQKGYWATKVATGIAGTTPLVGEQVQDVVQGGNEYGNLTLTRFFAIHVFILPGALILLTVLHVALFRRHGVTPRWSLSRERLARRTEPFWPDQLFRDLTAMALTFAALVGLNIYTHGAELGAPADPASNFDARPEWYFRPLFQALKYFEGTMEQVVALGMPVVVGGVLLAIPFVDRSPDRSPLKRLPHLAPLALIGLGVAYLTFVSFQEDAADGKLQERWAEAEERAERARELAARHGVPPAGGRAVFEVVREPFEEAREIWNEDCAPCHQGEARKGPEITYGYNSRAWIRDFLKNPGGDRFFGLTEISGMDPVELSKEELDAAVELIYSESEAADVDEALARRGKELWEESWSCDGCHPDLGDYEAEAVMGPNLTARGSRDALAEFIGRSSHPRWFGDESEMPDFYDKYNLAQREQLAEYLIYLRDAEPPARAADGE